MQKERGRIALTFRLPPLLFFLFVGTAHGLDMWAWLLLMLGMVNACVGMGCCGEAEGRQSECTFLTSCVHALRTFFQFPSRLAVLFFS